MTTIRGSQKKQKERARRVAVGEPDPQLTPAAGLEAVREIDRALGITPSLDDHVGAVKQRRRGLSGGQLLMALASAQLTGEDHLVGLDRRRADTAGQQLEPAPTPASTTAAGLAKRFTAQHVRGIEAAVGAVNTE